MSRCAWQRVSRWALLPLGLLAALLAGVAASLAANVAAAEPTTTARVVAAWPAVAFAVAFELLLKQRRPAQSAPGGSRPTASDLPGTAADVEPAAPVASPPADRVSIPAGAGGGSALVTRAVEVIAEAGGRRPGRRVLARELGCTEHRARTLLDALSTNDTYPVDGGPRR